MDDLGARLAQLADDVAGVFPPPDLLARGKRRARRQIALTAAVVLLVGSGAAAIAAQHNGTQASTVPTVVGPAPVPVEATAAALRQATWTIGPRSPLGGRVLAQLVWTGQEVVVLARPGPVLSAQYNAAYNPQARTWRRLAPAPPDIGAADGPAVWLDHQVFVFRGSVLPDLFGALPAPRALLYDPRADLWTRTSKDPLGAIVRPVAVRVGTGVLVLGPSSDQTGGRLRAARYDPGRNRWRLVNPPFPSSHHSDLVLAVATPVGVLVWSLWHTIPPGGLEVSQAGVDVARFRSSWTNLSKTWPQAIVPTRPQAAGAEVLSGITSSCVLCRGPIALGGVGWLLDPQTLAQHPEPAGPLDLGWPLRLWTGAAELDVVAGLREPSRADSTAVLDPATGTWIRLPAAPHASANGTQPIWTGHELIALADEGTPMILRAPPPPPPPPAEVTAAAAAAKARATCASRFPATRLAAASTAGDLRFSGPFPVPGPLNFPTLPDAAFVALCLVPSPTPGLFSVYGVPDNRGTQVQLWTQGGDSQFFRPG